MENGITPSARTNNFQKIKKGCLRTGTKILLLKLRQSGYLGVDLCDLSLIPHLVVGAGNFVTHSTCLCVYARWPGIFPPRYPHLICMVFSTRHLVFFDGTKISHLPHLSVAAGYVSASRSAKSQYCEVVLDGVCAVCGLSLGKFSFIFMGMCGYV